jgi:hypothetical protein
MLLRIVARSVVFVCLALAASGCGGNGDGAAGEGRKGDGWRRLGGADAGLSLTVPPDWMRLDRSNVDEWAADQVSGDDARKLHSAVFNNAFVHGVFVVEPNSRARTSIDASCLPPTSESLDVRRTIKILKLARCKAAEQMTLSRELIAWQVTRAHERPSCCISHPATSSARPMRSVTAVEFARSRPSPTSPTGWARSSRGLSSPSELSIDQLCLALTCAWLGQAGLQLPGDSDDTKPPLWRKPTNPRRWAHEDP